ncbi:hypothetical protein [Salinispira pacifica]
MINDMKEKRRYARRLVLLAAIVLLLGLLAGCEKFFTTNLLSGLRRNPADMSPEQQIQYAQEALGSGDAAAMKSAFDALTAGGVSGMSTEQKVLAVQCANGAQDIQSEVSKIAEQWNTDQAAANASIDALAQNVDSNMAATTVTLLNSLSTSTPGITADDYALAAITQGLLAVKANIAAGNGGVSTLQPPGSNGDPTIDGPLANAQTYFNNSETILSNNGQSTDTVSGIAGLFNA